MNKKCFILLSVLIVQLSSTAQSISTLNNILSTYGHNIKTNVPYGGPPYSSICVERAHNMKLQLQDNLLIISFDYAWDEKLGCVYKDVLKINLSTATFYTGYWNKGWANNKWEHGGKKEILTIKDDNGMDLISTGQQNYNKGTKHDLIPVFYISFASEPVANRIVNEIYAIQQRFKVKEAWLLPEDTPKTKVEENTFYNNSVKKENYHRKSSSKTSSNNINSHGSKTKKIGKYVQ